MITHTTLDPSPSIHPNSIYAPGECPRDGEPHDAGAADQDIAVKAAIVVVASVVGGEGSWEEGGGGFGEGETAAAAGGGR